MSKKISFTKKSFSNGVYEAVYQSKNPTDPQPELTLKHLGEIVGETYIDPIGADDGSWLVRCKIPGDILSDGIQTLLICTKDENVILDSFSIQCGEPIEDDLINEISLLRQELDMLKRAFRRHCVETMG